MPIRSWSTTPLSNQTADVASGIGWPENQDPSTVNDSARAMMAELRKQLDDENGTKVTTGSAGAYAVTLDQTVAYADGLVFRAKINHANPGAATINVNGLGVKSIVTGRGTALPANALAVNQVIEFVYVGGSFQASSLSTVGGGGDIIARVLPVGAVIEWTQPTIPAGWIWLTGTATGVGAGAQLLLKASYPELNALFAADAYKYGSDSTRFTLPPVGARFARAATALAELGTLQASQNKLHDHAWSQTTGTTAVNVTTAITNTLSATVAGTVGAGGAHSHTVPDPNHYDNVGPNNDDFSAGGNFGQNPRTLTTSTAPDHTHPFTGTVTLGGSVSAASTATASTTIVGDNAPDGGTEARPDAIYVAKIMLVSPAAAAESATGVYGLSYAFDTETAAADPGNGRLRLNNATITAATSLIISETDAFGTDLTTLLGQIDDSTSAVKARLRLAKVGAPGQHITFALTAAGVDAGAYRTFAITGVSTSGTFANGDTLAVAWFETGDKGDPGPVGPGVDSGLRWLFATATAMTDPGAGNFRFDSATLASVSHIALSINNGESGNPDVSGWLSTFDDSSSATKGQITIRKSGDPSVFAVFRLDSLTAFAAYYDLDVTYLSGAGTFTAATPCVIDFRPNGDAGTGAVSSVFGRSGAVSVQAGDYSAAMITNTPSGTIAAVNVQTALNELDAEKQALTGKNAASGYAGLDASSKLTRSQQHDISTRQIFAATGTWTKPTGLQSITVEIIGAGGGGGGAAGLAASAAGGSGGGGGGYSRKRILAASLGATEAVTIGAAGTGGADTGGNGTTGGTSSFGAHCSASGGLGGIGMAAGTTIASVVANSGGSGSNGDLNFSGNGSFVGLRLSASVGIGGQGGGAALGSGGGRAVSGSSAGTAGQSGGGGGGAASNSATGQAGGSGGPAAIYVTEEY